MEGMWRRLLKIIFFMTHLLIEMSCFFQFRLFSDSKNNKKKKTTILHLARTDLLGQHWNTSHPVVRILSIYWSSNISTDLQLKFSEMIGTPGLLSIGNDFRSVACCLSCAVEIGFRSISM